MSRFATPSSRWSLTAFRYAVARLTALLIAGSSFVTVGWSCRDDRSHPERPGIAVVSAARRSGGQGWQVRRSNHLGIDVAVPVDLCGWVDEPTLGVAVLLHELPRPTGVIDDKRCLAELRFRRLTLQRFTTEQEEQKAAIDATNSNAPYHRWNTDRHDTISRFDEREHTYYRYDLRCPNGELVRMRGDVAKVYDDGRSVFESQDDSLVRRILSSVRCLPLGRDPGRGTTSR